MALQKKKVEDPVCGMKIDPTGTAVQTSYNGVKVFFCANGCKKAFDANPGKYIGNHPKGFWRRYLDRLNKATGGRPPSCCK